MKRVTGLLLMVMLVLGPSAGAHRDDLISARGRAGPIVLGETTYKDVKKWFGDPTSSKWQRIGCVRLPRVLWGNRLIMIIGRRSEGRTVQQVVVNKPVIRSSEHGPISVHTHKGLEIGDTERKLQRLYPKKEGQTHNNHTHYILKVGPGRLLARVEHGKVINLLAGPYEFC